MIGNKGSGKSALLDMLGLLGDSHRQSHASFLSASRFKKAGDNKAEHYEAKLEWASNEPAQFKRLDQSVLSTAIERVTYLPQQLFDGICNELAGSERGPFDAELKRVIFSHVKPGERQTRRGER